MKTADFESLSQEMIQRIYKNLFLKRAEYADDTDCLSNFKQPTSLMNANPAEVCLWYDTKHFASMVKIARDANAGKLPDLATLQEKVGDYLTYGLLFYGCMIEVMAENQLATEAPQQGELFSRDNQISHDNQPAPATNENPVNNAESSPKPDEFPLPKHRFWKK